jgi:hypothetical protein
VLAGGAHFVAIGGFRERPSQYVHVEDPWYGPSDVAYATLVSGYQGTGSGDSAGLTALAGPRWPDQEMARTGHIA